MSIPDKYKLIAADTLARVVVYGPLAAAAVVFCPPALAVLALAAAQPWLGDGVGRAALWAEKKWPAVMTPVNKVASKFLGMQWWKHLGVAIVALGAAIVPAPAIAAHLPEFAKSALDAVGGANQIWTQYVLPFALATGLPFATRLATDGFDWVFQKIPALQSAVLARKQNREQHQAQRQVEREALRAARIEARQAREHGVAQPEGPAMRGPLAGTAAPAPPAPEAAAPAAPATPELPALLDPGTIDAPAATQRTTVVPLMVVPAVTLMGRMPEPEPSEPEIGVAHLRRVNTSGRKRIIRERPRVLPEVLRLSTPPRIDIPEPPSNTGRPDLGL